MISNAMYDYYWPGYEDSAPLGRNTVCLLTEVASARLANPIEVAAKDLRGATRGLPQYAPQINFPNPWPGGTWRLGDIVDYNLAAMRGLLRAASRYQEELLLNFHAMGRRAIEQDLYALDRTQRDQAQVNRRCAASIDQALAGDVGAGVAALAVDQHQHLVRRQAAERCALGDGTGKGALG